MNAQLNADPRGVVFYGRLKLFPSDTGRNRVGPTIVYTADGSTTDTPVICPVSGDATPIMVGYILGGQDGDIVGVYRDGVIAVQGVDANGTPAPIGRGTRLSLAQTFFPALAANPSALAIATSSAELASSSSAASIDAIACTEIPAMSVAGPVGYAIIDCYGAETGSGGSDPASSASAWDLMLATPLQSPNGYGGVGVLTAVGSPTAEGIPTGTMSLVTATTRGQLYVQQEPGAVADGPKLWRRLNGYRLAYFAGPEAGPLLTPANSVDGSLTTTLDPSLAVAIGSNPGIADVRPVFGYADFGRQQWIDQFRSVLGTSIRMRAGNPAGKTAEINFDTNTSEVAMAGREAGGVGGVVAVKRAAGVSTETFSDDAVAGKITQTITAATNAVKLSLSGTVCDIEAGNGVVSQVSKLSGSTTGCSVAAGAGAGTGRSIAASPVLTPIGGYFGLTTGSTALDDNLPFATLTVPTKSGRLPLAVLVTATANTSGAFEQFVSFTDPTGTFGTKNTATTINFYSANGGAPSTRYNISYIIIWA